MILWSPCQVLGKQGERIKKKKKKIPSEIIVVYNGWIPTRCQALALYFFIFMGLNNPQATCQVPPLRAQLASEEMPHMEERFEKYGE